MSGCRQWSPVALMGNPGGATGATMPHVATSTMAGENMAYPVFWFGRKAASLCRARQYAAVALAAAVLTGPLSVAAQQGMKPPEVLGGSARPEGLLQLEPGTPPAGIAAGAEVVLISGYESLGRTAPVGIEIDRPGAKVLLVLSSYEKVHWRVSATRGTTITGIVVGGYKQATVEATAPARGYLMKLPYAYTTENIKFERLLSILHGAFGITKVDAFRGSYTLPETIRITQMDPPAAELTLQGPLPKPAPKRLDFELLTADLGFARWNLSGPQGKATTPLHEGGKLVHAGEGTYYRLSTDAVERIRIPRPEVESSTGVLDTTDRWLGRLLERVKGGGPGMLEQPAPAFSHAMDIAYDTKRAVVAVASLGGEGFFYRFDTTRNSWLKARSLEDIDVYALAYDAVQDRFIGPDRDGRLMILSPEGKVTSKTPKSIFKRLEGFGRLYDGGNDGPPYVNLVARGDDLAIVAIVQGAVRRIWHYNWKTDTATLTY